MKEILTDLDRWQQAGEQIAIATVVDVRRSAPRRPGARLGVTRSGKMTGSVSGGCVENDVMARAMTVLDSGECAVATYGITDEAGFRVGLSCGGAIDVLIEPFAPCDAWRTVRCAVEERQPAALSVALAPADLAGRKLAIFGDGSTVGTIDPELDEQVRVEASRLLPKGGTRVLTLPRPGGEASVFIEAFPPPLRLFIVGATHTGMSLCKAAKDLGFRVTVVDARSAFATRERFPNADELRPEWPDAVLGEAALDPYSYVVILTHDPKFDIPALVAALRSTARYIGIIGSRGTHAKRQERLREQGFSPADLSRIRAPVGLDIGARTPEEIAVAILAEMLAVRYARRGTALTDREAPIHADD
jgi:xanthine dehydrogenase accessory factor